jgi:hypothetical protein
MHEYVYPCPWCYMLRHWDLYLCFRLLITKFLL